VRFSRQAAQGGSTIPPALNERRRSRRRLVVILALGALLVLVPATSTVLEARASVTSAQADATLEVIVTGVGDDSADPAIPAVTCVVDGGGACASTGVPAAGEPCKVTDMGDAHGCQYTAGVGQRVTLAPVNTAVAGFVGWSEFDCEESRACSMTMDSDRTVVATWTPTSLRIAAAFDATPNESITAKTSDGETKIVCTPPSTDCTSETFKAFDEVTLTAEPATQFEGWIVRNDNVTEDPSAPNYYLAACHEDGDSATCKLRLTGNDVVGAKFKDAAEHEPVVPPRKNVTLRVVVEPKGAGTVTSSRSRLSDAINCGLYCSARFQQDEHPRLTADAAAGSRFVRWQGGSPFCVSDTTCRYPALRSTSIKAVFGSALRRSGPRHHARRARARPDLRDRPNSRRDRVRRRARHRARRPRRQDRRLRERPPAIAHGLRLLPA
jgi:Divergent InlB B-repeat domain